MNSYLKDTEYAAKGLFELALSGDAELKRLSQDLQSANAAFAYFISASMEPDEDLESDEDVSEDGLSAAGKFQQRATGLKLDIAKLERELADKDTALQALCGAILQTAKQGISTEYHGHDNAPEVRLLAPSPLRLPLVIWEGRNQAMHYEDKYPRKGVEDCFRELCAHFGPDFKLAAGSKRSRARQVLQLLGWTDYQSYLKDMKALLP